MRNNLKHLILLANLLGACNPGQGQQSLLEIGPACNTLERVRAERHLVGLTAAVMRRDRSIVEFALGDSAGEKRPLQPGDKFLSGSIGKTYVAALAAAFAGESALDLDAPVARLLGSEPWYRRLPNADIFTLRQLLTHTSGLPTHVDDPGFQKAISDRIRRCPECSFAPVEAIRFTERKKALFSPGKGWAYSETGYLVAGLAIEKATGRRYYDLLRQRILAPLQLAETVPSDRNDIPRLASGRIRSDANYFSLPPPLVTMKSGRLRYNPAFEWTGGGVAASSADLARWGRLLYAGEAFSSPYIRDILSIVAAQDSSSYGLGVEVEGSGANLTYGHTGGIPGYRSMMRFYPATGVTVAAQVNDDSQGAGLSDQLAAAALHAGALVKSSGASSYLPIRCGR